MNTPLLDKWKAYLLSHASSPRPEGATPRAVTISRETGAGAVTVAQLLAAKLDSLHLGVPNCPWAIFDRNLVKLVLKDHRLPESLESYVPEDAVNSVHDVVEEMLGLHPSSWTLVQHTNHTIHRLALAGNVILVGRGSHLICAGLRHVLHVRLVAPLDFRTRHVQEFYQLSRDAAAALIRKQDRARSRYIRRHFGSAIQDPLPYHLTINTARVSFPTAAHLIACALIP